MTTKKATTIDLKTWAKAVNKSFTGRNVMAIPKLEKIVIGIGIGNIVCKGSKDFGYIEKNLAAITGRKHIVINAKKSVSNFKLREGTPNALMVTLRGDAATAFLQKMINLIFPRIRDFHGFSLNSFDGKGNYSLGIKEISTFPEVQLDSLDKNHGVGITICTTSQNKEDGLKYLQALGFPFVKPKK